MTYRHEHRWDRPHRGRRRCKSTACRQVQFLVATDAWKNELTLPQFANNWLPAISGTDPKKMMAVDVAFPFEWNCYESWNVVWRVRFDFTDVLGRREHGLGTPVDIMNGWRSGWSESWVKIDAEARLYFAVRTGKPYEIGDNTYGAMREIIQR